MSSNTPKTILLLAANPKGTTPLRLDKQVQEIGEGLLRSRYREQFELVKKGAVRPRDIQRAMLDEKPQIVHFSGHGAGEEGLVFEDEVGQPKLVAGEALAGLFKLFAERVLCVVLNGCYSQVQAEAIAQHIPYVVGMKRAIGDKAAIAFAVGFYDALGAGKSIKFAYELGCNAIQMEGIAEHLTPVLLFNDIQQQVVDIESAPTPLPSSSAEEKYREEVKRLVRDNKISDTSRHILNEFKQKLDVSQQTAEKIEAEILQPFHEYQKRLDKFLQVLVEQIHNQLPFSAKTQSELREIQKNWNLKNEHVEKIYIGLANELYKQNRLEESVYIYKEALAVNPNNVITHEKLAYILLQRGQIDEAITEYREAICIEQNNIQLHVDLGKIFDLKGQFEKAIEVYQQAIQLNTDDTPDDLAKIHYLLGCTFCKYERLENAIQEYTQAIKIKPKYAEAYAELGDCQYRLKIFVDAANNLRKAIAIKPDNPKFHFYLGMTISSQGKYKDAIVEFEKAIELNIIDSTPDPIVYTHYAFALFAQNKQKKAKTEIELAIKLFRQQNMDDAAKQMEHLFEQIKKESSWKSLFQRFR